MVKYFLEMRGRVNISSTWHGFCSHNVFIMDLDFINLFFSIGKMIKGYLSMEVEMGSGIGSYKIAG